MEWTAYLKALANEPPQARRAAKQALKQAAPTAAWRRYRKARRRAQEAHAAAMAAERTLKKAARAEMRAYDDLCRKLEGLQVKWLAYRKWKRLQKAIAALERAAPSLWETFLEMRFDGDQHGMRAMERKMSQTAPAEWTEYQAAERALTEGNGDI